MTKTKRGRWLGWVLMGLFGPLCGGLLGLTGIIFPFFGSRWVHAGFLVVGLIGSRAIDHYFYDDEYLFENWP